MFTIGVVGCGFVGNAVEKGFGPWVNMRTYDIDPKRCSNTFEETVNSDFVFVCLPTPMVDAEGGEANLEILEGFFEKVAPITQNNDSIYVIKSTVPIGTTRKFSEKYGIKRLIHNPEFLTAKNAVNDFLTPSRNIVGGSDLESVEKLRILLSSRFPSVPCYVMTSDESEMVKYVANCFLATKVIFFNEMRLIADKLGVSWDSVVDGVVSDIRIGKSHSQVPGHDGDAGIGGTCVLPTAKIKQWKWDWQATRTIEKLYDMFHNPKYSSDVFKIESANHDISKQELKKVTNVTRREVNEELFVFDTENGEFVCTSEHLMPVSRDGKVIIIPAKEIKDTDMLFSK